MFTHLDDKGGVALELSPEMQYSLPSAVNKLSLAELLDQSEYPILIFTSGNYIILVLGGYAVLRR